MRLSFFTLLPALLSLTPLVIGQEATKTADQAKANQANQAAQESDSEKEKESAEDPDNTSGPIAGHSYHGEAFNEGPRQQAYLMKGMPNIEFPITSESEEAKKFFIQGVGQLHGFWYLEAERSFRQALTLDPKCAMAYWGMGMANRNNTKRSKVFMDEAKKLYENVTDREKRFIDMLHAYVHADPNKKKERAEAYVKALEALLFEYPDDIEARAILALHLWGSRSSGIPIPSHLAVDALLQQVFAKNPMHPCHHYRIHLWDYEKPETAVSSAARCGQTSPGIAHMWHMPGHIFSRLRRYEDAVFQQEASARVDHAHMMRDQVLPDQIHNFAHNNEWLCRNLMNIGRVQDAINLSKNSISLPRHPKYNTMSRRGSSYYGRQRLFTTLLMYERWEDLIELCNSQYLDATSDESEQIKRLRHLGIAYVQVGNNEATTPILEDLQTRLETQKSEQSKAEQEAETKEKEKQAKEKKDDKKALDKAKSDARRKYDSKIRSIEQAISAINGYKLLNEDKLKQAHEQLKKAGAIDKILMARLQWKTGDVEGAIKTADGHVDSHKNEVQPLALYVQLLWDMEKKDDAKKRMSDLQAISSSVDMQSPVFERVTALAEELGCEADWRTEPVLQDDIGDRPELDTLGPFRWSPPSAENWILRDHRNKKGNFAKISNGKPTVVIFYLGHGCLLCTEQLQKFAPMVEKFEATGVNVVAVSTDSLDDLKASVQAYADEGKSMPIPLYSDESLDVFKTYRAYDGFEDQPLHGTFLVDTDGLIRWQDISYEPFMDVEFVLSESKRLLGLK